MVQLERAEFRQWQGDYLITSLKGQPLCRTRIEDGRVMFAEPIRLGPYLRDIAATHGSIYIVTTSNCCCGWHRITRVTENDAKSARRQSGAMFRKQMGGRNP